MPDNQGRLSQEEKRKAQAWLQQNWKNWVCPYSGHRNWELGDIVVQGTPFIGGGLSVGGPVYPLLVITCSGCGNTVFINAIKAGIVAGKVEGASDGKQ
jgi:predicted nucleic-acid-binding Zn-ribbon protein